VSGTHRRYPRLAGEPVGIPSLKGGEDVNWDRSLPANQPASLVSAFILALFFHWLHVQSLNLGLLVAFHVWLGFVATVQLSGVLFMKQSMKLFAMNTGYQLACYLSMGAILTVWR
jgi:hypothetical protein